MRIETVSLPVRHCSRGAIPLLIVACLFLPSRAAACGTCAFAMFWTSFPPILSWCALGCGWYLVLSFLALGSDSRVRYVPYPIVAVPLLVVVAGFGMASAGPLGFLPFLAAAAAGWALSGRTRRTGNWSPGFSRAVDWTGRVALAALVVTAGLDYHRAARMSPADRIAKWSGTPISRSEMRRLKDREPESTPEYRKLVSSHDVYEVNEAARRLAEIGEVRVDGPLVLQALERHSDVWFGTGLKETIEIMTKRKLPDGATPAELRRVLREQLETTGTIH